MLKCLGEIINAAKGAITKKEAERIIKEIEQRFNAKMPKNDVPLGRRQDLKRDPASMTMQERMVLAAEEAFLAALKEKQEAVRRQQLQVQTQAKAQQLVARYGHGTKGVQELLLRDVAARAKGIEELLMAELYRGLEPYMAATGHKMDADQQLEVLKYIADPELMKSGPKPDASPAELLARSFRLIEDKVYDRIRAAGSPIKYVPGHFPQAWDPNSTRWFGLDWRQKLEFRPEWAGGKQTRITRMRNLAAKKWIEFVRPLLDVRAYIDPETGAQMTEEMILDSLESTWLVIATNGLSRVKPENAMGQKSLADQLAEARKLHFLGPKEFLAANNAFGSRDLFTSMTSNIRRHANNIAQLEVLGPNPEAGFKTALAYGMQYGAEKSTFGREGSVRARAMWDEFTGRTNMVAEDKFDLIARTMQGARESLVASKLGYLPFSQIADVATLMAFARSNALGMGDTFKIMLTMLNPKNKADRALARDHALLASAFMNDVLLRFNADSRGVSWTSKAANAVMTLSGAKYMTDALLQTAQLAICKTTAAARELSFDELEPAFARMLKNQGITAEHWDIIRQAESVKIGHMDVITPMTVKRAITKEMDASASLTGAQGARAEAEAQLRVREATERYGAMLADESRVMVLHPGLKEAAIAKAGTRPGELAGELTRNLLFFKTFSIAMVTKLAPRIFSGEYGPARSRAELAVSLLAGLTIAGALRIQLVEILKGRNPRYMFNKEFWMASFMQAGGFGIFGDFLFADANRFGQDLLTSAAGPVAGMVSDLHALTVGNTQRSLDGKTYTKSGLQDFAGDAIQFTKNYAPLMNLWYTRLALDHLLFYRVQEAVNPGYLQRMKRRVKDQQNQTFWWDPNDSMPESGPSLETAFGGN